MALQIICYGCATTNCCFQWLYYIIFVYILTYTIPETCEEVEYYFIKLKIFCIHTYFITNNYFKTTSSPAKFAEMAMTKKYIKWWISLYQEHIILYRNFG